MNLLSLEVRHRLLPLYNQGKPPKTSGLIESIPQNVSTNRKPKPRIVSNNDPTVRRPSVGPGTTRANKPKSPRRPMTLGLNNPPIITHTNLPRRSDSSLPTIGAATQPGEFETPNGSAGLPEPIVELSAVNRETQLTSIPFSRLDIDEVQLDRDKSIRETFERSTKANIDATQPTPDLYQPVALRPDSWNLQPGIPKLTDLVLDKTPPISDLHNLPTLDEPIQPLESELQFTDTERAERVSALSIMKLDVASQSNPLTRNDVIEAPLGSIRPLLSTIDRPTKTKPVDPSQSNFELARSIAWRPDSLRLQPRIPSLTDVVSTKKPSVPATNLPTLDAAIQPIENELSITEITLAEPVSTLTVKPHVATRVNRLSRKEPFEVSVGTNRPLLSTVDRPSRANVMEPSESNSESVSLISFDVDSKKARPSISGTVLPVRSEQLLIADPNNQSAIDSHLRAIETESRISESKKAESVPKLMVELPVNNSQIKSLPRVEFSESNFDAGRPLRSRITQLRSKLANRGSNQPRSQPLDSIGFGPNFNRPISRIPRPLTPILTKIFPKVAAKRIPAPPKPASQFVAASGVVTLDGEILKAATIELVREDVADGKTDQSSKPMIQANSISFPTAHRNRQESRPGNTRSPSPHLLNHPTRM